MPRRRRGAQRARKIGLERQVGLPGEPHEVAHPDIVHDIGAVAEPGDRAQQAGRGLVVGIVIGGRDAFAMRGHQHVAQFDDRARTIGPDARHGDRSVEPRRQPIGAAGNKAGGNQRDEHAVDIARKDRLARQPVAAFKGGERQGNLRVGRRSHRIVPEPDVPHPRLACGIAPLDRQRWPVGLVERDHAG